MADEITLTLEPPYIGSAYSPQVTVEEIEGGHSVTITSDVPGEGIVAQTFDVMDGDASQAIEDAEAAAAAARAAASSASSAATSATNAAGAASAAAEQASTAAGAATDAASAATGAATSATAAAADATEAAGLADDATAAATAAASNAGTATREAIEATTAANNAAATANAAAGSATDAASDATTAAGTATDAATSATTAASAANTAADAANAAAEAATEAAEGITDAWLPRVAVGASDGITGGGPLDTAAWTERACPGTDGPARIESIHGNTIVQDGELLPVRMTGVESVGFNQWDEVWESGQYSSADGTKTNNSNKVRCKNPISVFPSTTYYYKGLSGTIVYFYDADGTYISYQSISADATFTTPANAWQMTFAIGSSGTPVTSLTIGTVCISLNGPRNGEYEPYWRYQLAIDAGVLRGAGSVYDELTATERIVRVGERAYQSGDESDPSVVTDGTTTHYALATPTTTPIDPPLNLTYKAAAGGTERILHDEPTAPPTMVIQYGSTADGIRDRALEAIAAHDGPVAQTYHAVGTYLTLNGTLFRVTTAIAAGERITAGTNVTATTVMAEVLALTQ